MFRAIQARSTRTLKIVAAFAAVLTLLAGSHLWYVGAGAETLNSASRGSRIVAVAYRYVGYP